ncbi:MAG: hypothetical protein R3C53_00645 [Pirellulaceae bacterium]
MAGATTTSEIKDQARALARDYLSKSSSFRGLPLQEQQALYLGLVDEKIQELSAPQTKGTGATSRGMIADFDGYDPGFDASVDDFEDLVDSVDFPKFVADLMFAVFDANLDVMKRQTDNYIKLLREATKATADFIRKTSDEDAFAHLVETKPNQFGMTMEKGADGSAKMTLTTPEGEPVDMEDNEVKARIVDAKIALAKEHRAALREVLLMGVTRLVVEKGEIEASVEFRITANRNSNRSASNTNTNVNTVNASYRQPLGGIFGGPSGSMSNVNTNINVRTSNQSAQDEMFAKLMGKVNIKFKTDYFKLDNFAEMYGDGGIAAKPQQQNQLPAAS